jgi:fatty acid synthase
MTYFNYRCLFVPDGGLPRFNTKSPDARITAQLRKDLLINVYQQGSWGSFRHLPLNTAGATLGVEHAYLNALTRGDLSSLKWIEGPLTFYR